MTTEELIEAYLERLKQPHLTEQEFRELTARIRALRSLNQGK